MIVMMPLSQVCLLVSYLGNKIEMMSLLFLGCLINLHYSQQLTSGCHSLKRFVIQELFKYFIRFTYLVSWTQRKCFFDTLPIFYKSIFNQWHCTVLHLLFISTCCYFLIWAPPEEIALYFILKISNQFWVMGIL